MADDVGVAVIVDNHVHLGDTSQFIVHLETEQIFFSEVSCQ